MATISPAIWGIPPVRSSTERDLLFPNPATNQRVHNIASRGVDRWDGVQWVTGELSAPSVSVTELGAVGDGVTDSTAAILDAMALGSIVFPDGHFLISDWLDLDDDQTVTLSSGTIIEQTTIDKGIFRATQKDNVWIHCNGAVLYGEGSWSAAWSSFTGHNDRGVQFLGCTNSGITEPRLRNFAMCGIVVLGGTNITIDNPTIEGTHALGAALTSGVSIYQFGILVQHDVTYGAFENVQIITPTIFNTAMGILSVTNTAGDGLLTIVAPTIHTFVAEHGLYLSTSNTQVISPTINGAGLDGIKIFSGVANEVLTNVNVSDYNITDCPQGQAVEFGVSGSGSISTCNVSGTARNCARSLTVDGDVRGLKARITGENMTQRDVYISGVTGPSDCEIDVTSRNAQDFGVLVDSATSTRNRIRAKVHRPGQIGGAYGIFVNACADLVLESPECTDNSSNMQYGVYCASGASNVRITGHPKITGYTTGAFFFDGSAEWHAGPGEVTARTSMLACTLYQGLSPALVPVTEVMLGRQSTSASAGTIWNLNLADESAYLVTARLVGKLSGSAQRGAFVTSCLFYRDGGGSATIQGSSDEDVNIVSGSFLGAYAWAVTGNEARLNVNSGATANIDWTVRITVTKIS
jgi:hypothetical protein